MEGSPGTGKLEMSVETEDSVVGGEIMVGRILLC